VAIFRRLVGAIKGLKLQHIEQSKQEAEPFLTLPLLSKNCNHQIFNLLLLSYIYFEVKKTDSAIWG